MFADRADAGRRLAARLTRYAGRRDAVVLGIPRGGVAVAAVVARELGLPLDVVLTKKIGHPHQPEFAIGVVDLEGEVLNRDLLERERIRPEYVRAEIEKIRALLRRREALYREGRPPLEVGGKTVLLVDDGIATGNTVLAAARLLRRRAAARVVVAAPVAPTEALERLRSEADEVVCVLEPPDFFAIGEFYEDFAQVSDERAIALLRPEPSSRRTP